jgi:multiple sugar transport system substrate-binding protein
VAQFFTRPRENVFGTVLAAFPDAHNIIYDFFLQLWTRGGEVLDAGGRPAFHGPVGIEALTFLRDLMHRHKVTPPDGAQIDSVKSGERFSSGQIAMMVNWMGFAAFADSHESSKVRGKVGCGLIPAGDGPNGSSGSLNIYWCLSIPIGSKQKEDAYRFLKNAARPEMDRITSEEGGIGVRKSTWKAYAARGVAGYAELEELHAHARHLPRVAAFGKMSEVLNEHLDRALNRSGDVKTELGRAAERCASLL